MVNLRAQLVGLASVFAIGFGCVLPALAADCELQIRGEGVPLSTPPQLLTPEAAIFLEVAQTPEERAIGLMHRKHLEPHHGMLFLFRRDAHLNFWMKDTALALDMVFADSNGQITGVISGAKPGVGVRDAALPIYHGEGCAVIEMPAGEAARDGLVQGGSLHFAGVR